MPAIRYAADHQLISALHSVVCIPKRFWKGPALEPRNGDTFQLAGNAWSIAAEKMADTPTTWRVVGPVWTIPSPYPEGCVEFMRQLWPFVNTERPWIKDGEEALFCFRVRIDQRESLAELGRRVGDALSEREKREGQ